MLSKVITSTGYKFLIVKLSRFCVTGFLGLLVDFSVTWFFKEVVETNVYLANSIGFTLAVICNYYINRKWTFKSNSQLVKREFLLFAGVSLGGLLLNSFFIYLLTSVFNYPFYPSKAAAIVLVFFWNYSANSYFTFNKKLAVNQYE